MNIDEALDAVWEILGKDEIRRDENYFMLLTRIQVCLNQKLQLLQDAADGHDVSIHVCKEWGLDATVKKYEGALKDQERVWPNKVQLGEVVSDVGE